MTVLIISGPGHWLELRFQQDHSFPHFNSVFKWPLQPQGEFLAHLWGMLHCPVCSLDGMAQTG